MLSIHRIQERSNRVLLWVEYLSYRNTFGQEAGPLCLLLRLEISRVDHCHHHRRDRHAKSKLIVKDRLRSRCLKCYRWQICGARGQATRSRPPLLFGTALQSDQQATRVRKNRDTWASSKSSRPAQARQSLTHLDLPSLAAQTGLRLQPHPAQLRANLLADIPKPHKCAPAYRT